MMTVFRFQSVWQATVSEHPIWKIKQGHSTLRLTRFDILGTVKESFKAKYLARAVFLIPKVFVDNLFIVHGEKKKPKNCRSFRGFFTVEQFSHKSRELCPEWENAAVYKTLSWSTEIPLSQAAAFLWEHGQKPSRGASPETQEVEISFHKNDNCQDVCIGCSSNQSS